MTWDQVVVNGVSAIPNWVVGVMLSFGGCTMSNLGVNMQKFSHTQTLKSNKTKSAYKHPLWLCGLVLLLVGSIADLVSFGFADMSLLAPLGAMTLVVNLFIAPCFNGENLTRRDVFYTSVILGGTILSISFGNKSSTNFTLEQLIALYGRTPFICYIIFFAFYMAAAFVYLRNLRRRRIAGQPRSYDARLESVAYPFLAGTFGAHSVMFAKSTAEVVKQTARGENQFDHPASYFLIFFLFTFLFLQMRILNEGLSKADALIIVPVYQVCWVMMNTVVGMVYFEDYKDMIPWHTVLFLFGVVITLGGVFLLSKRDSNTKPKIASQIREEGGYIEEVVSIDDQIELDPIPPSLRKIHDGHDTNEESEVRNPFIDVSISDSSNDDLQQINPSNHATSRTASPPLSPTSDNHTNNNGKTILEMGDIDDEDDGIGMETLVSDDSIPNPVHHPPKKLLKNQNPTFSLSWSWWARGGTRKLYTPLF